MKVLTIQESEENLNISLFGIKIHCSRKQKIIDNILKSCNNQLVKDISSRFVIKNKSYTIRLLRQFIDNLESINDNLYSKLDKKDQRVFVNYLFKRYVNLDTVSKYENYYIKKQFEHCKNIFKVRKSCNDIMEFNVENNKVKFVSNCPVDCKNRTKEQVLMNYYSAAHAFLLTEYKKEGFEPKDGQVIFDCGASIGDTALLFRTLYPNSPIYSFEFNDENIEFLKKNIEINNFKQIYPIKTFLYSKKGESFINNKTFVIDESVNEVSENYEKISTLSVDEFVKEKGLTNIGFLKFDIEGGEQNALMGSIDTIKTQKPILAIPIYHLESDIYKIPEFLHKLNMPMQFVLKWTEKRVWGVDCVLFAKFLEESNEKTN